MDLRSGPAEVPIVNVVGEKVALGPLRRDLLPLYDRWDNDFTLQALSNVHRFGPETSDAVAATFDRLIGDDRQRHFTIYERVSMRPIGRANLRDLDHYNRTGEFGISIGEHDCWGKGYGSEATILVLDYGFTVLDLHSVLLTVLAHNERAIRAYRRAGFHVVGRWREAKRFAGQAHDIVFMDCLATDFRQNAPARRGALAADADARPPPAATEPPRQDA